MRLIDVATKIAGIAIERKLAEERIQFMATHDALTGVLSRASLKERLIQALRLADRRDRWAAVVFVDLDNFKYVNDSLGHNVGDELLRTIAKRLIACVRATDAVVRIGGDEFVLVLGDQEKMIVAISDVALRTQAAIAEPIAVEGHTLRMTGSIGVAIYPNDADNADALIANADAAMYRAKENGRNNFQFFRPEINLAIQEKFTQHEELRAGIARSEFTLHYQPQIDLSSGGRSRRRGAGALAPSNARPPAARALPSARRGIPA